MNYLKNLNDKEGEAPPPLVQKDMVEEKFDIKNEESKGESVRMKDKSFTPGLGNVLKKMPPLIRNKKGVYIIGIWGGHSCGKSTLVEHIKSQLGENISIIKVTNFYKPSLGNESEYLAEETKNLDRETDFGDINLNYDVDNPDAIEFDLLIEGLKQLKKDNSVDLPAFNKITKTRESSITFHPTDVVIVEGSLAFTNQELCDLYDLKIYIEADDDVRLTRRLLKEKLEAEKDGGEFDVIDAIDRYEHIRKFAKPAYDKFIEPTKRFADMVITNNIQTKGAKNMSDEEQNKTAINRSMLILCNVAEKVCNLVTERN